MDTELRLLVDNLVFAEGPRWHDGALWFSDMYGESIHRVSLTGDHSVVLGTPGRKPSGLGFLPGGDLLFVSMKERVIMRFDGSSETLHADLSSFTGDELNDMVVDLDGGLYVGSYTFTDGLLLRVDPDGGTYVAAEQMTFPNGMVITPDHRTLIVTESMARHHSAFDIGLGGRLSGRRIFAAVEGAAGDGLALDAEGALWSAMPLAHQFVRVLEGGTVTDRIDAGERMPVACALGGPDRRDLFLLSAAGVFPRDLEGTRTSRVEVLRVNVPGAGIP